MRQGSSSANGDKGGVVYYIYISHQGEEQSGNSLNRMAGIIGVAGSIAWQMR
jgi:hypothetical protein